MAEAPSLIYNDRPGAIPATYRFPPGLDARLSSVSAVFDGTGAGGDFLACLSVFSQDDKLIGRFFPGSAVAAGDVAEVTFAPFLATDAAAAAAVPRTLYMGGSPLSLVSGVEGRFVFDSIYNNTLGVGINGTNDVFTMPGGSPEQMYAVLLTGNMANPAPGFTSPFKFYARGWTGIGNGGNEVPGLTGDSAGTSFPFSWTGSNVSGGFWSVDLFQNSGKTVVVNCEVFAWLLGPDGF